MLVIGPLLYPPLNIYSALPKYDPEECDMEYHNQCKQFSPSFEENLEAPV